VTASGTGVTSGGGDWPALGTGWRTDHV